MRRLLFAILVLPIFACAAQTPFDGTWKIDRDQSAESMTLTVKSSANGITLSNPIGELFDAKFDGGDYPFRVVPAGITVSLTKENDRSIILTFKRDGKIVRVEHTTVSADGKTMHIKAEDKLQGTTITLTGIKQ